MRFTLAVDGLEANWIEFKDFWTRREGKELYELGEAAAFDKYIASKCLACHIEDTAGQVIEDPADLTYDTLDDLDARVFGFIVRSLYQSYREQVNLGKRERAGIIKWCRSADEDRADEPDELVDSWLLGQFPGRFLEEIDQMDWGRYLRAMQARVIAHGEERRKMSIQDVDKMTEEVEQTNLEHDRLLEEFYGGV